MTKIIRVWYRMTFWEKVKKFFRLIASVSIVEMGIHEAPLWAFIAIGCFGVLAETLDIFINDKDNDGVIDPL